MIFISNFASSVDHDENNPSVHHIEQTQNRVRYKPPHHYEAVAKRLMRNGVQEWKKNGTQEPTNENPFSRKIKKKNAKGRKKETNPNVISDSVWVCAFWV